MTSPQVCMFEKCTLNYVIDVVPSFINAAITCSNFTCNYWYFVIIITDANKNTCMVYGVKVQYGVLHAQRGYSSWVCVSVCTCMNVFLINCTHSIKSTLYTSQDVHA